MKTPIPEYEIAVRQDVRENKTCFRFASEHDTFTVEIPHRGGMEDLLDMLRECLRVEAKRLANGEFLGDDEATPQVVAERVDEILEQLYQQLSQTRFG